MLTNNWLTLNQHTTVMPKRVIAPTKENVDVTALLKKMAGVDSTENSEADTVEILDNYKTAKKPDTSVLRPETEELVNYVRERANEIRGSNSKNIPAEIIWGFMNADPNKESIARAEALGEKYRPIEAKMLSGKKLSAEEMSFLKEHFPEAYTIAKRIEQEREQFHNQLKNCATQEEKNKLALQKKSQLMGEAKKNAGFVILMLAAIDEEIKRNGGAGGTENSAEDTIIKTSFDPVKNDSGADEKDKTREPPAKLNTATQQHISTKKWLNLANN